MAGLRSSYPELPAHDRPLCEPLGLRRVHRMRLQARDRSPPRCPLLHARLQRHYPPRWGASACGSTGQCDECPTEWLDYPLPLLDDHAHGASGADPRGTPAAREHRSRGRGDEPWAGHPDPSLGARGELGLYVLGLLLVQCRRGGGLCLQLVLYGSGLLADVQVGGA